MDEDASRERERERATGMGSRIEGHGNSNKGNFAYSDSTGYTDLAEPPFLPRLHILAGTANNLTHTPTTEKEIPTSRDTLFCSQRFASRERPSTQDLLVGHANATLAERNKWIQRCRTKRLIIPREGAGRDGRVRRKISSSYDALLVGG